MPAPGWPLATLIDAALELTVVGSFSEMGPAIRSRLFGWTPPPPGALAGRTVLVTGPTSGLGRAATDAMADLGARIVLVGRARAKLEALRDELTARHGADRFPIVVADLESLASVRAAVAQVLATETRLDVLVDNAGAINPERRLGPDGIEATLALMVVGPFVLTAGLLPLLRSSRGRLIDDLGSTAGEWSGARAYSRAKRAQTAIVREWARRLDGSGVTFDAMHPGWADTPGLAESLPGFHRFLGPLLRSPADGADTIVWLAAHPDSAGATGQLLLDRRPRPFDRAPMTRLSKADRVRLWDRVVALAGGVDPAPAGGVDPASAGGVDPASGG